MDIWGIMGMGNFSHRPFTTDRAAIGLKCGGIRREAEFSSNTTAALKFHTKMLDLTISSDKFVVEVVERPHSRHTIIEAILIFWKL